MARVFISYRRADSGPYTGRIYDRLAAKLGRKNVFKDVDNIPPGVNFPEYIQQSLRQCDVVLVVIGPGWLDARDDAGRRRLGDPEDFVRIEIETALNLGLAIIPILLDGVSMPPADALPEHMRALTRHDPVAVRQGPSFDRDMLRVFAQIETERRWRAARPAGATGGLGARLRSALSGDRAGTEEPTHAAGKRVGILVGAILLLLVASVAVLTGTHLAQVQAEQAAATRNASASETGFDQAMTTQTSAQTATTNANETAPALAPFTSASPSCDGGDWTVTPSNSSTNQTAVCKGNETWVRGNNVADCYLEYDRDSGYPSYYVVQVTISGIAGRAGVDLPDGHSLLVEGNGAYQFSGTSGSVMSMSSYMLRIEVRATGGTATINDQQVATYQPGASATGKLRLHVTTPPQGASFISAYFQDFAFTPLA